MKIRVAPAALDDLRKIKAYIENELSNSIAANNVIKRIIKKYNNLDTSPYMGTPLSTKVSFTTDYRFIVSGNYLIFYKVEDEYVSIYRILYGRSDYLKVIFGDELENEE